MSDLVLRAAGVLAASAGIALASRPRCPVFAPAQPGRLARIASRYDRSRGGERLAVRLWRAQLDITPSRWRCGQASLAMPTFTLLLGFGASPLTGAGLAMTAVRFASSAALLALRKRAPRALDAAAPSIARRLATELAASANGNAALLAAARRSGAPDSRVAAWILDRTAARVVLGGGATTSLRDAMDQAVGKLRTHSPAGRVAAIFALHHRHVAACADALQRMARGLEDDASTRREIRATVSEVRMSALAVPLVALATALLLFTSDPAALVAALSPPLLPFLAVAVLVVVAAVLSVRRLTAL